MTGAVLRPLDIGQVMLLLTLGAWLLRGLARREIRLPVVPLIWPLVIFVGWAAISLLWAPSVEYAALEVIKWAEIILIMLMVTEARQTATWLGDCGGAGQRDIPGRAGHLAIRSARHRPGDIQDRRASVSRLWFVRAAQSLRRLPRSDLAGGSRIAHRTNFKSQISNLNSQTRNFKSLACILASCALASCSRLASCYLSWRSCFPGRVERGWARWRPSW